jgi:hypothetical protein
MFFWASNVVTQLLAKNEEKKYFGEWEAKYRSISPITLQVAAQQFNFLMMKDSKSG